jgi:thiol-disulfide isomerase/thioredoxin
MMLGAGAEPTSMFSFLSHIPWSVIGGISLVVILLCIGVYLYVNRTSAAATGENPNDEYGGPDKEPKRAEMCMFYVDWCPHCKTAKVDWAAVKAQYDGKIVNGHTMVFTEYDCTNQTAEVNEFMDKHSIESFPTIKLHRNGEWVEYQANVSKGTLIEFMNTAV